MALAVTILMCAALIVAGAIEAKPGGYVVCLLGTVALLLAVLGPRL